MDSRVESAALLGGVEGACVIGGREMRPIPLWLTRRGRAADAEASGKTPILREGGGRKHPCPRASSSGCEGRVWGEGNRRGRTDRSTRRFPRGRGLDIRARIPGGRHFPAGRSCPFSRTS